MNTFTHFLAIAGACILIAALIPIRKLVMELHQGKVRRQWYFLGAQVLSVIAGYLAYTTIHGGTRSDVSDLIVSVIFFFVACLVLTVNIMSVQTAQDVRRIAVLEQENVTDPLMGIYNRRYLESRLRQEAARVRRHDLPLSVLLLDIDHFKRVNDTRGHQVGDSVLRALGKLIAESVRIQDVVTRYGGEEVLILAPDTPVSSAATLAERLRRAVEDAVLVPPDEGAKGRVLRITVSIGVATLGPGTSDTAAFLKRADDALYRAKHNGRNQVVVDERAND